MASAVAIIAFGVSLRIARRPALAKLIEAARDGETRPLEARLSGFAWSKAPAPKRSSTPNGSPRVRLVALDVVDRLSAADDVGALHARGIARLLAGDEKGAIADLTDAAQRAASNASFWSDLAAAHLAQATRADDVEGFANALALADRALSIDPRLAEAQFNRALALESLGLAAPSAEAYEECRRIDTSSGWSGEVTERLGRLRAPREDWRKTEPALRSAALRGDRATVLALVRRFPQQSRTWAETEYLGRLTAEDVVVARAIGGALAEISGESLLLDAVAAIDRADLRDAHVQYRQARMLYAKRQAAEALPILQRAQAAFATADSPMSFVAGYYSANALTDLGRIDEARAMLAELAKAPKRYHALHAQLEWQTATIASREGRFHEALAHYRNALDALDRLGESEHATTMEISAATCLATLGSFPEAWRMRRSAFERASEGGNVMHLQQVLAATARWEVRRSRWDIACAVLKPATDEKIGRANVRLWVDTLVCSARAERELGHREDAARSLARAREVARSIPDAALREDAEADVAFAEAAMLPAAEAIASLTKIAAFRERNRRSHLLVEALTKRGRRYRQLGRFDEAAADFGRAADLIDAHANEIGDQAFRSGFSRSLRAPYEALVDLLDRRGLQREAFEVVERSRIAAATELGGSLERVPDIQKLLPPGAWLVSYYQLEDRLLIAALSRDRFVSRSSKVTHEEMKKRIGDVSTLYGTLIAPIEQEIRSAEALVVIADAELRNVPFAALRRDAAAPYLIEQMPIAIAPSASILRADAKAEAEGRELLVRGSDVGREALRAAEQEIRWLRTLWPSATVIDQNEATPERVRRELPRATLFHFTGHAAANAIDASLSYLATHSAPLYVRDVTRMRLPSLQLAFLAGCETAMAGGREAAPESLATAFVLAGARNAVGSLWEVDDRITAELSTRFYRELQRSGDAPRALREAQLSFIRSGDPRLSSPTAWAAMQMYGSVQ